ncbi:MAG: hypothetical protein A2X19_08540 [Bacteroidetes bacterium GWE2_39_28]|nr:MAG: hypothetical protein A2X19_08540 [Bacteroidetes bacterium GWE2_39_28]OFY14671.1 MAG: hypothetical protein A2X16_02395 [Bacteroidetes bacterium GWF2_39_10]OFZ07919.1 MAG: hypothetical protein A2322_08265 [Bacteroidetes bacterium RIFOXYB2_FULL_39_7]OFZ12281.1 MAG: hypothetical protein A2465_10525 [Bacteroidetes bacterium RIFOXYC2_FULL_39_11]HCT94272.1 hypothetical protein [Rikenellaceae bacterium]
MKKTYTHPIVGDVLIVKGLSLRTLRLSVNHSRGVRLSIPWHVTYSTALKFLESKIEWVAEAILRQREKASKSDELPANGTEIKTQAGTIVFTYSNSEPPLKKVKVRTIDNKREIIFDNTISAKELKSAVVKILRKDAAALLPARLSELAALYGFSYGKLTLRNNVSNWGSCSARKNINLNIHLIRLPRELSDYVLLHELAHLKHRNHGPEFHRLLDSLCGGREKELSKQLRKSSPRHF